MTISSFKKKTNKLEAKKKKKILLQKPIKMT